MSTDNILCWVDIPALDLPRAIAFYSALLGQAVTRVQEHGMDFGLLPHVGNSVSGCLIVDTDNRPSTTGALIYLSVEGRLDDALGVAQAQGGIVLAEKQAIGPYGFRAIIKDSEGNRVALHSMS
jgi:hypothetical protein